MSSPNWWRFHGGQLSFPLGGQGGLHCIFGLKDDTDNYLIDYIISSNRPILFRYTRLLPTTVYIAIDEKKKEMMRCMGRIIFRTNWEKSVPPGGSSRGRKWISNCQSATPENSKIMEEVVRPFFSFLFIDRMSHHKTPGRTKERKRIAAVTRL